jgi:hypothetical protein
MQGNVLNWFVSLLAFRFFDSFWALRQSFSFDLLDAEEREGDILGLIDLQTFSADWKNFD